MTARDVIGIGLGPANLSLAALLAPVDDIDACFLEAKPHFQWHSGIMLPDAQLQVSYLKDLVTLVDPTSRYSFLNFLRETGRLYRAIVANDGGCSRQEFEQYYQWAADQLSSIRWKQQADSVRVAGDAFEVRTATGELYRAPMLVVGTGKAPSLPACAVPLRGAQVLHGAEFMHVNPAVHGRDVMVIGGGQSGAEIVNYLIGGGERLPASLIWVSSRAGFLPLDDSPFVNEWFTPSYVDHFFGLPPERRKALLATHRLASDGISENLLREIYRRLYRLDFVLGAPLRHRLLAGHRLSALEREDGRIAATLLDGDRDVMVRHTADVVILCTGYRTGVPAYLEPLRSRLVDADGSWTVSRDYSLAWDGPANLRIFVQNAAEATHGVADPNLSLAAWRSATIANSLAGRDLYRVEGAATSAWTTQTPGRH
jgi:lysine N6-hydroxylase